MSEPNRPGALPRWRALISSARVLVRRRRLLRWVAAAITALAAAWWTSTVVADAERQRAAWATTEDVWVLTRGLAAGEAIRDGDVRIATLPAAAVPPAAAPAPGVTAAGRRLRVDGHEGEILLGPRLAPAGASPTAARLPVGTLGLVIPADESQPLEPGDTVDLFGLLGGRLLEDRAPVVAVGERGATVAVDAGRTGEVIVALAEGGVVLALRP